MPWPSGRGTPSSRWFGRSIGTWRRSTRRRWSGKGFRSSSSARPTRASPACSTRWRGVTRRSSPMKPGTTRDLIEVALDLGGAKVRFVDTAGIRRRRGKVEDIGISRALELRQAPISCSRLVGHERSPSTVALPTSSRPLAMGTKSDLVPGGFGAASDLTVSSPRRERAALAAGPLGGRAAAATAAPADAVPFRARHLERLARAAARRFSRRSREWRALELRAEELGAATRALGRLTGPGGCRRCSRCRLLGFLRGQVIHVKHARFADSKSFT